MWPDIADSRENVMFQGLGSRSNVLALGRRTEQRVERRRLLCEPRYEPGRDVPAEGRRLFLPAAASNALTASFE